DYYCCSYTTSSTFMF
nr:immunoglobulin light chain junction region [Macaca mulatta]